MRKLKTSAHVHEKAVTESLSMSTTIAHEIPLSIKAMFLLEGHCIFAIA